jgi:hypothetical protein
LNALALRLAVSAAILLALSIPAFRPDYYAKFPAVDGYTHAHALLGALWLLALIAQPLLIRSRRMHLHRTAGRTAWIAGVAFVASSVLLTHHRASRMDAALFEQYGYGFYLPLVMALLFAGALFLGVLWRRAAPVHARFMVCTALPLIDPVTSRLLYFHAPPLPTPAMYQAPAFTLSLLIIFLLLRSLPAAAAGRATFAGFAAAAGVLLLLNFATPYSSAWMEFMYWFRNIPLT